RNLQCPGRDLLIRLDSKCAADGPHASRVPGAKANSLAFDLFRVRNTHSRRVRVHHTISSEVWRSHTCSFVFASFSTICFEGTKPIASSMPSCARICNCSSMKRSLLG